MSKIEVNEIDKQSGSTLTLGGSGTAVTLACGATQTGFGRTGTVDWQTGSIKTTTFTAANGEGYFADTSSGAITMNLPAGTAGNIVSVVDYTNTFQNNALTITPNGSQKIGGIAASQTLSTEGQSVTFVYVDDTEGWKNVQDSTSNVTGNPFLQATGGTETICGNCKIHTFTGPGTFTVNQVSSNCAAENTVSHLVVAGGGGGGGGNASGGGGAGGFREIKTPITPYTASPLDGYPSAPNRVTVTAQAYPITVGGGGSAPSSGSNSIFSTITSAGGGSSTANGGSGGGASYNQVAAGSGNTPPVSPPQGNGGGGTVGDNTTAPGTGAGGGGGATAVGQTAPSNTNAGNGGSGATTSITGSPVTYSGGGGGGVWGPAPANNGRGAGTGGGGDGGGPTGSPIQTGQNGTDNTGGGAGGGGGTYAVTSSPGGTGGSGIVVIRYKFK